MQSIVIPISREKLEQKRQQIAREYVDLPGDSGSDVYVSQFRVTADYSYDGTNLKITIKKKPLFLFPPVIEAAIRSYFA